MTPSPQPHWCEAWYDLKSASLILYGRALGLSHGEAEDVLQETFAALLRLPGAPAQPEYYIVRSFRNQALNQRRSLWRRLTREWESARWFEQPEPPSPAESLAMLRLANLPQAQREAIVLKLWHGHTFEEIGTLLQISAHTAASRYRYGLQKIKAALKGTEYEREIEPASPDGTRMALLASPPTFGEA